MKTRRFSFCMLLAGSLSITSLRSLGQEPQVTTPSTENVTSDKQGAKTWALKYRFSPDETLRYSSHQTMTLTTTLESGTQVDVSEFKQLRTFRVRNVDAAGRSTLEMTFDHVWMKKKMDDQKELIYESTMKPADVPVVFRQVDHQIRKLKTNFYLNSNGTSAFEQMARPTTETPVAESRSEVQNAASLVESETEDEAIRTVSATSGSASDSQEDPGTFLLTLPEHPVAIGETWKHVITVPVRVTAEINRNIQILRTFRLESVEGDIATVSFRSSIESPLRTPAVRGQLIQAVPKGTMTFDIASGRMLKLKMSHNQTVFGAVNQNGVLECVGESTDEFITESAEPKGTAVPK